MANELQSTRNSCVALKSSQNSEYRVKIENVEEALKREFTKISGLIKNKLTELLISLLASTSAQ